MKMWLITTILVVVSFFAGMMLQKGISQDIPANTPVCHALTEDSVMSDCDYHDGYWWTK